MKRCHSKCKQQSCTSVTAWMEAPYFTSSSITLTRFFLQAMCRGVKPFCRGKRTHSDPFASQTLFLDVGQRCGAIIL